MSAPFRYHLRAPSENGGTKDWVCRPSDDGGLTIEYGKTTSKKLRLTTVPASACAGGAAVEAVKRVQEKSSEGYTEVDPSPATDPGALGDWASKRLLKADVEAAIALFQGKPSLQALFSAAWDDNGVTFSIVGQPGAVRITPSTPGGGSLKHPAALLVLGALSNRIPGLSVALRNSGLALGTNSADTAAFIRAAGLEGPDWKQALVDAGLRRDLTFMPTADNWF